MFTFPFPTAVDSYVICMSEKDQLCLSGLPMFTNVLEGSTVAYREVLLIAIGHLVEKSMIFRFQTQRTSFVNVCLFIFNILIGNHNNI